MQASRSILCIQETAAPICSQLSVSTSRGPPKISGHHTDATRHGYRTAKEQQAEEITGSCMHHPPVEEHQTTTRARSRCSTEGTGQ